MTLVLPPRLTDSAVALRQAALRCGLGTVQLLAEHLSVTFKTVVLGVEVTVKKVDLLPGSQTWRSVRQADTGERSAFGPSVAGSRARWGRVEPALGTAKAPKSVAARWAGR